MENDILKYAIAIVLFAQLFFIKNYASCEKGEIEMKKNFHFNNANVDEDKIKVREKFTNLYKEWQRYINRPDVTSSSKSQDYISCKPYNEMIKMGESILPYLIEKMDEGRTSGWKEGEFFLWYAIRDITGVDLSEGESEFAGEQYMAEKYIVWWQRTTSDRGRR